MTHNMLDTLGKVTIPRADRNLITRLLQPHGQRRRITGRTGDENANEPTACRNKPTAETAARSSTATLTPGVWINNKIIKYVGRVLIVPNQQMNQAKVHVYPTFFMSRLHNESAGSRGYNFKARKNNDDRIDGRREALDKRYIPINVNNAHCNFIRVAIENKTIRLIDSQEVNAESNKHLQAVGKYMYNVLT